MRIVSWNCCRRGFAGVIEALAPLSADLLFLQEVGYPGTKEPPCVWRGAYERQGVAIVALSGALTLSGRAPGRASALVDVAGPTPFRVLNVWAHPRPTYPADVHATLDRCRAALTGCAAVVAGDFNSSVTADTRRQPRHASLVARLRDEFGLVSAYHEFHDEQQGRESAPTYFHLRRPNAPWHIDYCFVPVAWAAKLRRVEVLDGKGWTTLSDHRPLVVDVEVKKETAAALCSRRAQEVSCHERTHDTHRYTSGSTRARRRPVER